MVVDEYGNRRFYGLYRAVVFANNDPLGQGRLKLRVPQVLGSQVTDWAWVRNTPGVTVDPPAVGHGIWVLFEGGDPSFPVVVGTFGPNELGYPKLNTSQFITYDEVTGTLGGSDAVPPGGAPGQILAKAGDSDYQTTWVDSAPAASFTEVVKHEVKAGEAISIGQAVYVSSADGTNMIVSKASNATEATSSKTMGLLAQTLPQNGKGYVITEGLLAGLNTGTATAGDPVWLGTAGNLIYGLANKPVAPAHLVFIGIVTRAQTNNGEIFVRPQNGFELNELHDVLITSPTNGQALTYDNGLWKNATPASTLDSLTDVVISAPADNEVIAYDVATGQWTNQTTSEAGISVAGHTHSATDIVSGTLDVTRGGTGVGTLPVGDYLKGAGSSAITTQTGIPAGDITGKVDVAHGGTGNNSFTSGSYIKGNGTSALSEQVGIPGEDITSGRVGSLYGGMPTGSITQFAVATAPSGWLNCDGGTFSSSTYPALAALLGDTYGIHSGTTYYLPDFRGRVAVGVGLGAGDGSSGTTNSKPTGTALTDRAIGAWGGAQTHALTSLQMPRHTHIDAGHTHANSLTGTTTFAANGHNHQAIYPIGMNSGSLVGIAPDNGTADIWGPTDYAGAIQTGHASWMNNQTVTYEVHRMTTGGSTATATVGLSNGNGVADIQYAGGSGTTQAASNGDAHPNIQPFLVVNYIIKT